MFIGNNTNIFNQYLYDRLDHTSINVISFFDNTNFSEDQLSPSLHNVLIFPIIDSYDEVEYSALGWKCAIKSAFEGVYTVSSIFLISPNISLLDDCMKSIHQLNQDTIVDNIWLWPDSAVTPCRNTEVAKLPYQTKISQHS